MQKWDVKEAILFGSYHSNWQMQVYWFGSYDPNL